MDITRKIVERLSIKHASTELGEVMAWLEEQDYDIIRSGALRVSATKAAARQLHTIAERVIDETDLTKLKESNTTLREIAAEFHTDSLRRVETTLNEARELLEELVAGPPEHDWPLWYHDESCVFCGAAATERLTEWRVDCEHTPDCIVTRIRAWLAALPTE